MFTGVLPSVLPGVLPGVLRRINSSVFAAISGYREHTFACQQVVQCVRLKADKANQIYRMNLFVQLSQLCTQLLNRESRLNSEVLDSDAVLSITLQVH